MDAVIVCVYRRSLGIAGCDSLRENLVQLDICEVADLVLGDLSDLGRLYNTNILYMYRI